MMTTDTGARIGNIILALTTGASTYKLTSTSESLIGELKTPTDNEMNLAQKTLKTNVAVTFYESDKKISKLMKLNN